MNDNQIDDSGGRGKWADSKDNLKVALTKTGTNLNVGGEEWKMFIVTWRILSWMTGSVAITWMRTTGSGASVDEGAQKSESLAVEKRGCTLQMQG